MFYGGKGGGSSFKQTPDNLRSVDTFEGVLGICIGPVRGPTRGLKSIRVDGTAIENETGELNFGDFVATIGDGDPGKFPQEIALKLGAGASPQNVGVSLPNTNTNGTPGQWQTRTMNNIGANFIDLRFIANQIFTQTKKGVFDATATLEIQMKPVGKTTWINPTISTPTGTYNEQGNDVSGVAGAIVKALIPQAYYNNDGTWKSGDPNYKITGKTTSPAVYELRIGLPNEGTYANTAWDIRIRLLERDSYSDDDGENQEKRTITWESLSAVYSSKMGSHEDWRGLAWMQLYGKASDQLTGIPEIDGEWDTKIISVPAPNVYNPETRQYNPVMWDGSWAKAWCNDPAWVINDAISDSLAGLSLVARGSFLNKWDALEASKWCSQLVPDGNGGTEPRYSLNLSVTQPQKAEEFIRYLSGAVGGLAWDQGDGEWRLKIDKPEAPVDLFTLENIENEFVYSHTDIDTRFNDIIGQFKNSEMDYRADAVHLYDNNSIALLGRKPTTIALVGCTGRQEAMRRVKLRLRAAANENRVVNFTTNRRGRNINMLDTILIADGDLGDQQAKTTGRVVQRARNFFSNSTQAGRSLPYTQASSNGITTALIASGTDASGVPYLDYRVSGTSTSTGTTSTHVYLNGSTYYDTKDGDVWTIGVEALLRSGTITDPALFRPFMEFNGHPTSGTTQPSGTGISPIPTSGRIAQIVPTPAGYTRVRPGFRVTTQPGQTVDYTVRLKGVMLEKQSGSTGLIVPTSGVIADGVRLRDPIYLAPSMNYRLDFTFANPSYNPDTNTQPANSEWTKPTLVTERSVVNHNNTRGSTTDISLDQILPDGLPDFLSVALTAPDLPTLPQTYRVMTVMPQDDGERISITAINVDTGKWDAADNVSKEDTVFQDLRGAVPMPRLPTSGRVLSLIRVPVEQGNSVNLVASWERPSGAFVSGFTVRYSINGGAMKTAVERTQDNNFEWVNPVAGKYYVEVLTNDRRGGFSQPLTDTMDVNQEILDAGDIKYVDGTVMEGLKPAEPAATNTKDPNSSIGSRTVAAVLADLAAANVDIDAAQAALIAQKALIDAQKKLIDDQKKLIDDNLAATTAALAAQKAATDSMFVTTGETADLIANTLMRDILDREALRAYSNGLLYMQGSPVGVVVQKNEEQRVSDNEVFAQTFDLLGAKSKDGSAWIMDINTVRAGADSTFAERFSSIEGKIGDNAAAIKSTSNILVTLTSATASQLNTTTAIILNNAATVAALTTTVATLDSTTASQFGSVSSRFAANEATVSTLTQTVATLDSTTATQFSNVNARFGTNEATVTALTTTVTNLSSSTATQFTGVSSRFDTNEATVAALTTTVATLDSSTATRFTQINTRVGTAEATTATLATTVSTLDSSTASRFVTVNSRIGTTEANVTSLTTTVTNLSSSTATSISGLTTRMGTAETNITAANKATSDLTSSMASQFSAVNTRFGTNEANVSTLTTNVSNQNGANATRFTNIETNVGNNGSAITSLSSSFGTFKDSTASTFTSINTRFGNNESTISSLSTTVTNNNTAITQRVDGITSRVGASETNITNLTKTVNDNQSALATSLDNINTRFGSNESSITSLRQAFSGPAGSYAKVMNIIDVNGNITGTYNTNTGATSSYSILANVFQIIDPNGGSPITPFSISGGVVRMTNVEVDRLKVGAMDAEFLANQVSFNGTEGTQKLPGGVIMKWGRYRGFINNEVTFATTFAVPFPNQCDSVIPIPYLATYSSNRDLWMQNVGNPTKTGFVVGTQAATSSDQKLDGFDWVAFGR